MAKKKKLSLQGVASESSDLRGSADIMEVNQNNNTESGQRKKVKTTLKIEGEESSLAVECANNLGDNNLSIECDIHDGKRKKKRREKDKSEALGEMKKGDEEGLKNSVEVNYELTKKGGKKKSKLHAVVCGNDSKTILKTQMSSLRRDVVDSQCVESSVAIVGYIERDIDVKRKKKKVGKNKSKTLTKTEKTDESMGISLEMNKNSTVKDIDDVKKSMLRPVVRVIDRKAPAPPTSETATSPHKMLSVQAEIMDDQCIVEDDQNRENKKTTLKRKVKSIVKFDEENSALISNKLHLESSLDVHGSSNLPDSVSIECGIHDGKRKTKNKKNKSEAPNEQTGEHIRNSYGDNEKELSKKKHKKKSKVDLVNSVYYSIASSASETTSTTQEVLSVHGEMAYSQDVVEGNQSRDIGRSTGALVTNEVPMESSFGNNYAKNLEDDCNTVEGRNQDSRSIEKSSNKKKKREDKLKVGEVNLHLVNSSVLSSLALKIESVETEDFVESANQLGQFVVSTRNNLEESIVGEGDLQLQNSGNRVFEERNETELGNATILQGDSFMNALGCETVLGRSSGVENEIENSLRCEIKKFKCEVCQRSYSRRDNLAVHMRTHSDERKFKCSQCERSFHYRHVLKEHLRLVHSVVQPGQDISFYCEYCPYKAKRKQDLQKHVNGVHLKGMGQLFPCHLCPSTFTYSSNLKKHIESIHALDEKLHVCHLCGKLFQLKQNLKTHSKIHNKNVFNCQVCNQEFPNLHNLKMHLGTHAPRVGFNCPYCDYVLVSESDERLKRHIREKHLKALSSKSPGIIV